MTGLPHAAALPDEPVYWRPTTLIGLRAPREELTARLDARVDGMWAAGLVDEVRSLIRAGIEHGVTASRAIGYAQALGQIRGDLTAAEAIEQTQQLTRRFARRQVSWFKRYAHTTWIDYRSDDRVDQALGAVQTTLA